MSGVPSYTSLTRLTYMNVELMLVPMEFRGKIPRAFVKLGLTCGALNPGLLRYILRKSCVSVWEKSEIEFKISVTFVKSSSYSLCKNSSHTRLCLCTILQKHHTLFWYFFLIQECEIIGTKSTLICEFK
jgi:hypothetical protein